MARDPRVICDSAALAEAGRGVRFRIVPADDHDRGFAVRHGGRVHAYVNRCPHAGTELDWEPGEFLDIAGLYLVCATHGALFEPGTGLCIAGPCRGASLEPLAVQERDGRVELLQRSPDESESFP